MPTSELWSTCRACARVDFYRQQFEGQSVSSTFGARPPRTTKKLTKPMVFQQFCSLEHKKAYKTNAFSTIPPPGTQKSLQNQMLFQQSSSQHQRPAASTNSQHQQPAASNQQLASSQCQRLAASTSTKHQQPAASTSGQQPAAAGNQLNSNQASTFSPVQCSK